jgi:hypothetical protein
MVDCPEVARLLTQAGPLLVMLATAMAVLVMRELATTAKALGWSHVRGPAVAGRLLRLPAG